MRVLGRVLLDEFDAAHPDARGPLSAWVQEVMDAEWKTPAELKSRYPSASLLKDGRVIFNIKGNRYRLLASIAYQMGIVTVERLGTHAEYDRWTF